MARYRFPGRGLVDSLIDMPLALPTAVAGITLTALFSTKGWIGAFTIAGLLSLLALVTLVVKAALEWRIGERNGALL